MGTHLDFVFVSDYRGEAFYRIVGGELSGRIIRIRYRKTAWYEQDFEKNWGNAWLRDRALYEREVMSSVGLVRFCHTPEVPPPAEVVEAISAKLRDSIEKLPELADQWLSSFRPGIYSMEERRWLAS